MLKHISITTILIALISSCGPAQKAEETQVQVIDSGRIDSSVFVIIPFDSMDTWMFKNVTPAELTYKDLLDIEKLLKQCIDVYNPDQERQYKQIKAQNPLIKLDIRDFTLELDRYKRQYVPVINEKGEKEVWVNCLCDAWNKNWRDGVVIVKDGGNCYFNLKINLALGRYYDLSVNGES